MLGRHDSTPQPHRLGGFLRLGLNEQVDEIHQVEQARGDTIAGDTRNVR